MAQSHDILARRYGPTLGKALASLFLAPPAKALMDVGTKWIEDALKKRADALEAERLLGSIQQEMLAPLAAFLESEGGEVSAEAVAAAAADTLTAGFSFESLVENQETPERQGRRLHSKKTS